jgi:hypothetical protein
VYPKTDPYAYTGGSRPTLLPFPMSQDSIYFTSKFVKDIDKRMRYIRIAAVVTALVPEGLYTSRARRERDDCT